MDLNKPFYLDTKRSLALRIHLLQEDGRAERPGCRLTSSVEVDDEGRVWVSFTCNTHGMQSWRELCAVLDARGLRVDPATVLVEGNECVATAGASDEDALRAPGQELVPLEQKGR